MSIGFGLNLLHVEYLSGITEVELLNHESVLFQALECIPDCSGGYTYSNSTLRALNSQSSDSETPEHTPQHLRKKCSAAKS